MLINLFHKYALASACKLDHGQAHFGQTGKLEHRNSVQKYIVWRSMLCHVAFTSGRFRKKCSRRISLICFGIYAYCKFITESPSGQWANLHNEYHGYRCPCKPARNLSLLAQGALSNMVHFLTVLVTAWQGRQCSPVQLTIAYCHGKTVLFTHGFITGQSRQTKVSVLHIFN